MGVTSALSRFTAEIGIAEMPAPVVARARLLFLDLAGNIIRGRETESTPAVQSAVHALGLAQGASPRATGDAHTYSPAGACIPCKAYWHTLARFR